jgi:hypothetical protein
VVAGVSTVDALENERTNVGLDEKLEKTVTGSLESGTSLTKSIIYLNIREILITW